MINSKCPMRESMRDYNDKLCIENDCAWWNKQYGCCRIESIDCALDELKMILRFNNTRLTRALDNINKGGDLNER